MREKTINLSLRLIIYQFTCITLISSQRRIAMSSTTHNQQVALHFGISIRSNCLSSVSSFVKHLLRGLLEFTATLVYHLLFLCQGCYRASGPGRAIGSLVLLLRVVVLWSLLGAVPLIQPWALTAVHRCRYGLHHRSLSDCDLLLYFFLLWFFANNIHH